MNPDVHWLIIGMGNEFRCDDGLGILIARNLKASMLPFSTIREMPRDGLNLLEMWKSQTHVILIDAMITGADVGTIHCFNPIVEELSSNLFPPSSHSFDLAETIQFARYYANIPEVLLLYGIEGVRFEMGREFSPEVETAIPIVQELIINQIQNHALMH